MTQDLRVERAGGNRALVTGGTCRFPNGCNTVHVRSYAGFTWICLGFAPSVFAVAPVLARNELSWCSKTLNSPHLVFFSRKAAGQPCSPLPALLPGLHPFLSSVCRVWAGACLQNQTALANKVNVSQVRDVKFFHSSYSTEGMLVAWSLLKLMLPLPQVGTLCVMQLQVSVKLLCPV